MASEPTDVHLNPIKVLHKLEEVMADDSIIVADGGDFVGTAAYILRLILSSIREISSIPPITQKGQLKLKQILYSF